jgi:hypothetical protein
MKQQSRLLLADYYDDRRRWWIGENATASCVEAATLSDLARVPDGFAQWIEDGRKRVLVGYFSFYKNAAGDAPDYSKSLVVVVDGVLFGSGSDVPDLIWHKGILRRTFKIAAGGSKVAIRYRWPATRQLLARVFSDPSNFVSKDFLEELVGIVTFYRPEWLRHG